MPEAGVRLASVLKSALGWFGKKIDVAADNFAKEFGSAAGKAAGKAAVAAAPVAVTYASPLGGLIADLVKRVTGWLQYVTLPF